MLKKKYTAAVTTTIITAVIMEIIVLAMLFLKVDPIFVVAPAFFGVVVLLLISLSLISKSFKNKIESCLYEECDPDKYLYEFTIFHGYKKVEYDDNRFNLAKLKAYTAMGKLNEVNHITEKINMKKLSKNKAATAEYNICMTAISIYFEDYDKAEVYLGELSKIKRKYFKKREIAVRQFRAELLRHQGNLAKSRSIFTSLNLAKRTRMDILSARLAVAYIDKAEKFDSAAMKNFELVAREANRLYIRELARNELKSMMTTEVIKPF